MLGGLRHRRFWVALSWVVIAFSLYVNLAPASSLPQVGVSDKIEHVVAYLLLMTWFSGMYDRSRYLRIAASLFIMGVAIEFAQGAMQLGRQRDYQDVIANSIGIVLGFALAHLLVGGWAQRIDGARRS